MLDLLSWLRSTIEGDKAAAEADQHDMVEWAADYVEGTGQSGIIAAEHIRRHNPSNTIARCKSDLALLDEHTPILCPCVKCTDICDGGPTDKAETVCKTCTSTIWPCRTVRILACGYSNRDGFDATRVLDPAELAAIFAGAEERRKLPAKPDDMEALKARLTALRTEGGHDAEQ